MKQPLRLLIVFLGIWLQGQVGAQPIIAVSPTSIDYGNIALPGDSTATVEIFNFGTADLIINALQITGADSDQFSLPNPPILPLIIPPGASPETVAVRFSPSRTGLLMGTFRILSNDSLRDTLDVPLRGVGAAPQIRVTPDTLRFGRVVVNGEKILPLEIANVGNLTLVVDDTSIVGNDDSLFNLVNPPPLPISIPPGGTPVTLSVRFRPNSTGAKSAFLVLTNNDPLNNPRNIPLLGTGVVPDIAVSHTGFSFGSVIVGEDSSFILQISNIGLGDLIISDLDIVGGGAPHFTLPNPPTLPVTIPPGGDPLAVEVQFAPLARGSHSAFLTITSNDPDQNPLFINLDGVGIKPDIVVNPAALQFDTVRVGGDSLLDLVIRNTGDAPLVVSDARVTGPDSAEFSIAAMPSLPFTVSTGNDSAVITLRFAPASAGVKQATLQLSHNDVDRNPLSVPLSGSGVEPDIAASPLSLDFGDVLVNTTDTLEVFIINEGGITLRVDSLRLAGPDADHFGLINLPTLPLFLPPGGGPVSITVTFTPDTVRSLVANLLIFGNDPDENPLVVGLTGNGVKPVIAVVPPTLDFGNVRVNFSLSLAVQISNLGTAPLIISDTAFSGADANLFSVASMPPLPFVIDVDGEPVDILIRFQPDSVGLKTALFELSSNDPDVPTFTVSLSGAGVAPDITTTADTLDFGRVRLGTESVQELPVVNQGTDFLSIFFAAITGPDFLQFKFTEFIPFPLFLAPGDTFIFSLSYTPDTLATQEAILEILNDDPDTPLFQINLQGTGALPHIAVDTTTVNFGTVKIGGDSLQTVSILNIGGFPLQVNEVRIAGDDSTQFQLADLPPTPFSVGPDGLDSVGITIRYRPTESARHRATVEILSDDSLRSPLSVSLEGRGVQAPTILEFSLSEVRLNTDLQINTTVTADTTIETVRVHFADNATPGFPNVVVLDTVGGGTYAGIIPGSNITTSGLKMVLEVRDAFPVSTTDTLYLQVNIPAGAITHTFDDQHRNRWRMFSLPFDPTTVENAAIGSVLSDLGPEGDFTWRIYRTDSSGINTSYFDSGELAQMGAYGRFEPGNAFWLYVRDDEGGKVPTTTIDFPDLQTVPGDSLTIWLQPGWNQIGNPYAFPLTWNQVVSPAKDSLKVYRWDGVAWSQRLNKLGWTPLVNTNFTLEPYEGYLVKNPLPDSARLTFMPGLPDSGAGVLARIPSPEQWQVYLVVEDGAYFDVNVAGVHPQARRDFDALDYPEPPKVQAEQITLYFDHPEWESPVRRFSSDFRPPTGEGEIWYLGVNSATRAADFYALGLEALPASSGETPFRAVLVDAKYRREYPLTSGHPIRLRDLAPGEERRFALIIGTAEFIAAARQQIEPLRPEQYQLLANYPNPFNPETFIRYQIPVSGHVKLQVFNLLGQEVITLVDAFQPAGYYEIRWDGRDRQGRETASGLYFYRLKANDFQETRKMIKLK